MKPLLSEVDAVLFDLDGTLVETNIDFSRMKCEMLALAAEAGLAEDEVQGLDILGIVSRAVDHVSTSRSAQEAEDLRSRAMRMLEEIELHHAGSTAEIEFARELIDRLRRHRIPVGIVTRNCRAASELSLGIVGIDVDVLICREDSDNHKPLPDPVLLALEKLHARPGNSFMIGDHTMDIQSGKSAGAKTIGFLRPDRPDNFFDRVAPDLVTRDLKEVLDAIIDCHR